MPLPLPEVQPNALMDAALDVMIHVYETDEGWYGQSAFYLSQRRDIRYEQRRPLKTKQGALDRQRRETLQFLKDLRAQIDESIEKLTTREPSDRDYIWAESSAYSPRHWPWVKQTQGDTDDPHTP